ncbi:Putative flagellar motility protein [hydrothermal vent metagenome]|uniref:Putative flagellar motility protein n=1 Tax=hydrothermal vent metagenome TaxID=652676 RepID=A0A1W1D2T7_9ZZZZ
MKQQFKSLATGVALGSAGIFMMSVISGCSNNSSEQQQQQQTQNKFLVIEQQPNGKYVVVEEMPTQGPSRAIIRERDENGKITERFMTEEEMKALAQQEYQKVQNGTSETLQNNSGSEGMGLAGTILSAAAGAMLGNMIANSLMNNRNFAQNAARTNHSPSAYNRSKSFSKSSSFSRPSSSTKRSFFGSSHKSSSGFSRGFGS